MKSLLPNWRINEQIRAQEVRVVGPDNKQIGVMSLSEALAESKKAGLDLVETVSNANPPIVKIVDLGKLRYQEEKKLRKEKQKTKTGEIKELRFSPFIAEHDYETRLERINEFLKEKNKVRLVVVFRLRQMNSKQFGYNLLKRIVNQLGDSIIADSQPKFLGRNLLMTISPTNKPVKKVVETVVSEVNK